MNTDRFFKRAQFIATSIAFTAVVTGFVLNIKSAAGEPDWAILLFVGIFIVTCCFLLVKAAYKELKKQPPCKRTTNT
jgi:hypothetical protein